VHWRTKMHPGAFLCRRVYIYIYESSQTGTHDQPNQPPGPRGPPTQVPLHPLHPVTASQPPLAPLLFCLPFSICSNPACAPAISQRRTTTIATPSSAADTERRILLHRRLREPDPAPSPPLRGGSCSAAASEKHPRGAPRRCTAVIRRQHAAGERFRALHSW
jgi:hypothetical protein